MNATQRVLEDLRLYGREALRSSFAVYWSEITTTYGLRCTASRSKPRTAVRKSTNLDNVG
jgi:hypothetical protein